MKRRVVITGLGVVTSLGNRVDEFWRRICASESGVGPITLFDASLYRARFGGEVRNWAPEPLISHKDQKRLDRFTQFALVAALEAFQDSALDLNQLDHLRAGVILGSGVGGLNEFESQHTRLIEKGPDKVSAFTIPKLIVNAASGHVSIQFGFCGPCTTVATACASATNAMGDALRAIQYDDADIMITGGSEAGLTPMGTAGFAAMRALSERNDDPQRASRPFDIDRDGFVLAEGAGILVFEELEHAKKRGARIYAEVLGYGITADGSHITQPDENGTHSGRAMTFALRDAKLNPTDIEYINAHGTSTSLGDVAETKAIKRVFGDHAYKLSISSTKSQLGHLLGASGGVELITTIMGMRDDVIPPTINLQKPDPQCDLDYTPNEPRQRAFSVAMSNSFGFGGHNGSIIIGKLR